MTASILEVSHLTKRFGGLVANDDISLSLGDVPGRIVSVIGPNGAGKSTLFKMLSGFLRPTSGSIALYGQPVTGLAPHVIARQGLVRTFQETTIFPELTAQEHVSLAHQLARKAGDLGVLFGTRRARADEAAFASSASGILDFLDIGGIAGTQARHLPHGHLRLLGIAMGLAASPRVLLLDEPFAGLNPEETERAMAMTRRIAGRGVSVLLVEHDMRAVMNLSDHIHVLQFGRKIAEGSPEEIRANPAVIEAYLGADDAELGL